MPLSNVIKRIGSRKKTEKKSNKNGSLQMYVDEIRREEAPRTAEGEKEKTDLHLIPDGARPEGGESSDLCEGAQLSTADASGDCLSGEISVTSEGKADDAVRGKEISTAKATDSDEMAEDGSAANIKCTSDCIQESSNDSEVDDVIAKGDQTNNKVITGEELGNEREFNKENLADSATEAVGKTSQCKAIFDEMQISRIDVKGGNDSDCRLFSDGELNEKQVTERIFRTESDKKGESIRNCVSGTPDSKSNVKCNEKLSSTRIIDQESLAKRDVEMVSIPGLNGYLNTNGDDGSCDADTGCAGSIPGSNPEKDDGRQNFQIKEVSSSTLLSNKPSEVFENQDAGDLNFILEEINISREVLEALRDIKETEDRVAFDIQREKSQEAEIKIRQKDEMKVNDTVQGNHCYATDLMSDDVVKTIDVSEKELNHEADEKRNIATSQSEGQPESVFTHKTDCDAQLKPVGSTQEKHENEAPLPHMQDLHAEEIVPGIMDDQFLTGREDKKRNEKFSEDQLCSIEKEDEENAAKIEENSEVFSVQEIAAEKRELSEEKDEKKTCTENVKQTSETKIPEAVNIQHESTLSGVEPVEKEHIITGEDLPGKKGKESRKVVCEISEEEQVRKATVITEVTFTQKDQPLQRTEEADLSVQEKQSVCQNTGMLRSSVEEKHSYQSMNLPETIAEEQRDTKTDLSEEVSEKEESSETRDASEEMSEELSSEKELKSDTSEIVSALTEDDNFSAVTENSKKLGEEIMEDPRQGWKVGYLHVKLPAGSKSRGTWKVWHRRWVMVHTDEFVNDAKCPFLMISVYASESGTSRRHSALFWRSVSADRAVVHRSKSHTHRYAFSVTDGTKVVVHLAATSETSTQEWMAAMRNLLWPPNPVVQLEKVLHGCEFEISLIDNDFSCHAGLLGTYGYLVVNSRKLILTHPQTGHVIQEWYLNTVDKFQLLPQCREEDAYKAIVMHTGSDSSTGSGQLTFFCADAIAMLQCIATTIHKVLQYRSSEAQTTADKERYQRELTELTEWLTPDLTNQNTPPGSTEDYYKVPRRMIRSLLDIPNFLFERPIGADSPEVIRPPILSTSTSVSSFSQDSGISLALPDDFLNCSVTSFTIGRAREHSSSESSDGYSPPSSPQPQRKEQPVEHSLT